MLLMLKKVQKHSVDTGVQFFPDFFTKFFLMFHIGEFRSFGSILHEFFKIVLQISQPEYFLRNREAPRSLCVRVFFDFALSSGSSSGSAQKPRFGFGFGKVRVRENSGSGSSSGSEHLYSLPSAYYRQGCLI